MNCGEKRKDLFKKGDLIVWSHWQVDYGRGLHDRDEILIEDRGVVLEIIKEHRSNILHDGSRLLGRGPVDIWKAVVLFTSGTKCELPLVCLEKI